MSDLPNHDHDPDPAALDELQRAFAADPPADESEPGTPAPSDDAVDDRAEHDTTPAPDHPPADEPGPEPAASGDESPCDVVEPTPEPGALVGEIEPAVEADGGDALPTTELPATDVDIPGRTDVEPIGEVVSTTELPATETPARVIKIDDYAGSSAIDADGSTTDGSDDDQPKSTGDPLLDAVGSATPSAEPQASDRTTTPSPSGSVEVISIGDDELPDAVYVEGSLDADGSGTIVFIEDDESGDVLGPESERDLRRGIEPRMRERRIAVKRAIGRRRLIRLGIVAGVLALIVAVLAVLGSPLFAVQEDNVEVFGARYTDEERLAAIIDDAVGTPVLRLDTDQLESDIEAIPWVEAARVRTSFPSGLTIDIRERTAWTTYQGPDGRFRVLDDRGRVLDVLDMHPFAYVQIGGPDAVDLSEGEFAPQGYEAASTLAKHLTPSMRGQVELIEVTADGSRLVVNLTDGSTVFFGEAADLLTKLVRLEAVLTRTEQREPGMIDVSTADVTR